LKLCIRFFIVRPRTFHSTLVYKIDSLRWAQLVTGKGTLDVVHGRLGACIGQGHDSSQAISEHNVDLVVVQKVRCDKGGTVRAGDQVFFSMEKETKIINSEQNFCAPQNSIRG